MKLDILGHNRLNNNNMINEFKNKLEKAVTKIKEKNNLYMKEKRKEEYRKENHIYFIEEDVKGKVYLWDITDKPSFSIEETNLPKELRGKATEGTLLKYKHGKYEFYSDAGYETLFNEEK